MDFYRLIVGMAASLLAAFAGHYFVKRGQKILVKKPTSQSQNSANLGRIERIIYVMAWFLDYPQFIGVWLAAKVVGSWTHYKSENSEGRGAYSEFLS